MTERELGSSLKGKIAATLIGMACAQGSNGEINFASPFVDDEGVDVIFFKKGGSGKAILVQVKSRTIQSKLLSQGTFRVQVRRAKRCLYSNRDSIPKTCGKNTGQVWRNFLDELLKSCSSAEK